MAESTYILSSENHNYNVEKTIRNYIAGDKFCNGFGILLFGKWGSGKTYFIKKLAETYKKDEIHYISLFGKEKLSEIELAVFKSRHKFLGSPIGSLALSIAQNYHPKDKEYLKEYSEIAESISNILKENKPEILNFFKFSDEESTVAEIWIFDDVERCNIGPEILYGYLSSILQNHQHRMILVCNKEEINTNTFKDYWLHAEKVIGVSLEYRADFDDFLQNEYSNKKSEKILKCIHDNIYDIKKILEYSGHNLRRLKQAIWRYEILQKGCLSDIPDEWQRSVFTIFICMRMVLEPPYSLNDIKLFINQSKNNDSGGQARSVASIKIITSDGNIFNPFPEDLWYKILNDELVTKEEIDNEITNCSQNWLKLWHYHDLSESEFREAWITMLNDIRNYSTKVGILLQCIGIVYQLCESSIITKENADNIIKLIDEKILQRCKENPQEIEILLSDRDLTGWNGYGFYQQDKLKLHLQKLNNKYITIIKREIIDSLQNDKVDLKRLSRNLDRIGIFDKDFENRLSESIADYILNSNNSMTNRYCIIRIIRELMDKHLIENSANWWSSVINEINKQEKEENSFKKGSLVYLKQFICK